MNTNSYQFRLMRWSNLLFGLAIVAVLVSFSMPLCMTWLDVRIARAVQIAATTLLIGMVVWHIPSRIMPVWLQRKRFPAFITLISLLLLLGQRFYLSGAGLGFFSMADGSERVATGILFNDVDNYFYASYPAQAAIPGVYTFLNAHTFEANPRIYVNLVFLIAGKIAALVNAPPFAILVCFGLIAMSVVIFLTYQNSINAGFSERAACWAVIFAAFASGVSAPILAMQQVLGITVLPQVGADYSFQDAITFSSFYAYPFHTIAYAIISSVIFLAMRLENDDLIAHKRNLMLGTLILASYLIASTHPYEAVILLTSYTLYGAVGVLLYGKSWKRAFLILSSIALGAVPASAMNYWVSQQPVWKAFSDAALGLVHPRWYWLAGYGVVLWLALGGSVMSFQRRFYNRGNWLAIWSMLLFLLLIVLNIPQSKILSGGYIPFSIMAGFAADQMQTIFQQAKSDWVRALGYGAAAVLALLLFATSVHLYIFEYRNWSIDIEITQLANDIKEVAQRARVSPTLLARADESLAVTAYAPVRAYVSHWALTPEYQSKVDEIVNTGMYTGYGGNREPALVRFTVLLQTVNPNFVILSKDTMAADFANEIPGLNEVKCLARYCLYSYVSID